LAARCATSSGLMAASTAMVIPVILVFFALQRYFVKGVVMTGLKG